MLQESAPSRPSPLRATVLVAAFLVAGARLVPRSALPLRTRGRRIVGTDGSHVRLNCVNWYGAHMEQMVANGLNRQPLTAIVSSIVRWGFNCVRLPYSLDGILGNYTRVPNVEALAANLELLALSPLEVYDATVKALTDQGLMVILNNHISTSGWCCSVADGEGLWYTEKYPESVWLDSLGFMAARYRHDPLVVGFDLRNELRPSRLGTPTWGTSDTSTDWSLAAVRGAERVVSQNSDILLIVSGLYYSIFLCDVPARPIHTTVPFLQNRTLYTSHEYRWINYHIMASAMASAYLVVLVVWCLLAWFGLVASSWLERRQRHRCARALRCLLGCGLKEARSACCPRLCCTGCLSEVAVAVLLTAVSVVGLIFTSHFMNNCNAWGLGISMASVSFAGLCGLVSLMFWMRLALATVQHLHANGPELYEAAAGAVGTSQEMAHLPVVQRWLSRGGSRRSSRTQTAGGHASVGSEDIQPPGLLCERKSHPFLEDGLAQAALPGHPSCKGALHEAVFTRDVAYQAGDSVASSTSVASGSSVILDSVDIQVSTGPTRLRLIKPLRSGRCLIMTVALIVLIALLYIGQTYGTYEAFKAELDGRWGFLLLDTTPEEQVAPVWVGEFGTEFDNSWWEYTLRYLKEREVDWAYWSLNGEKWTNHSDRFGLFMEDSQTVRHPWKLRALQELMNAASPLDALEVVS